jgi:hypothetical protein
MTRTTPRKWTATVSVAGQDFTPLLELGSSDTLRETERAAVELAARLIREEEGSDGAVLVYKQLATDERPRFDRSIYVYRDWTRLGDAIIRTQR